MTINRTIKPKVQEQIKNWKKQINELFESIESWILNTDYRLSIIDDKIEMYEEPMRKPLKNG